MVVNDRSFVNQWTSFEVAAMKRMSNNWQVLAAFSASKKNLPFGSSALPVMDPNASINVSDRTWEWVGKFNGSYRFGWDVLTSANYQVVSGEPYARQVRLTGGQQIRTLLVNVESIGTRQYPNAHLVDIRTQKDFRLGGSTRLGVRVDVFNVFNTNVVTAITTQSGPSFERPVGGGSSNSPPGIMPARIVVFSASFTY